MNQKIIVKRSQNLSILPEDKPIDEKIAQDFCHLFQIVPIKTKYPFMKDLRIHVCAGSR